MESSSPESLEGLDEDLLLLNDLVDQKLSLLDSSLSAVEGKASPLLRKLVESRDAEAELRSQVLNQREVLLQEVCRLQALLQAQRLQSTVAEERLQQAVVEERIRAERMRVQRDEAYAQRDDALAELATAFADMEAMQATLADSAVYVRYLRKKVLELEVENTRSAARSLLQRTGGGEDPGPFSLASIKTAIKTAVQEACACEEEEKRKRLRQLQLRWHPDKNPVLAELATEVTKLINEAVKEAEAK